MRELDVIKLKKKNYVKGPCMFAINDRSTEIVICFQITA